MTEVGQSFIGWAEGEMDIHHIYTGRGESSFLIFPDGTSMLIDAGDWDPSDYDKMCDLLPDSSRRSGEWIARYIKRINPSKDYVDYLLISHFHSDHIGDSTNNAATTKGRSPNYVLTGIAEVGENIRFGKLIDRGWPDYQYPLPMTDRDFNNYHAFVRWKIENDELCPESFIVGSSNQIALLKKREKYSDIFKIQNLAANGKIWTGSGLETINYYDLHRDNLTNWQNENTKSIAMKISYGSFSYFTGGDVSGSLLNKDGNLINIEEEVSKICGKVDVCKANHHGYKDAMVEGFLRNINAFVYIIPVWDFEHIQPSVINRVANSSSYENRTKVFPTNFPSELRYKYNNENWFESICKEDGHVVVKVLNNGKKFKIYVLSANDEKMIVKSVYGPFSPMSL